MLAFFAVDAFSKMLEKNLNQYIIKIKIFYYKCIHHNFDKLHRLDNFHEHQY